MRWGGEAPAVPDEFEVELAAALTGTAMRVDTGLGPRTEAALIQVAVSPVQHRWRAAAAARRAFEVESSGEDFGEAGEWIRARCFEAATRIATLSMSWCSNQAGRADAATHRRRRDEYFAALEELDPANLEQVLAWIARYGPDVAQRRVDADPEQASIRLSPSVRVELFRDEVVPVLLRRLPRSSSPTAVLVAGPPGGGVAVAVRRHAAELPDPVVVQASVLAGFHPHWWAAGTAGVSADVTRWLLDVTRRVADARATVVVGVDIDGVDPGRQCARLFERTGYRVRSEMVTTADPIRRLSSLVCDETAVGHWEAVGLTAPGS